MTYEDENKQGGGLTPEQLGGVLAGLNEVFDQVKFANPEVDGAAEIPGCDPFELLLQGERFPEGGILVNATTAKGYEGVIEIVEYDDGTATIDDSRLELGEIKMRAELQSIRVTQVGYENPNYFYKNTEPGMRNTPTSYLSSEFAKLDITTLSDGGRLFVLKEPEKGMGASMPFLRVDNELDPQSPSRRIVRLFDAGDHLGVTDAVGTILSKVIGVASQDVDTATTQIKGKLTTPPQTTRNGI